MAFPTIPTVADGRVLTTVQANTTATRTFPNLSSLTKNSGDLLVAIIAAYQSSVTNAAFSSWGGGFTEFHDSSSSTTMAIGIAYKWSTGSETGTFTVTQAATITGHAAMILLSIPGAHATTVPEAGSRASGTSAAADPAAFDPSGWDVEDTLWIAVAGSGETGTGGSYQGLNQSPQPTYGSDALTSISADVVGGVQAGVGFAQIAAASEDVGAWSLDTSNARNAAVVVAIRPAAAPVVVTPDVAALSLTAFVPVVSTPVIATPGVLGLTVTALTPTVAISDHQTATPGVAALTLTPLTPTVTTSANVTATPGVASLTLTPFAPTVEVGGNVEVVPGVASLTLTAQTPTVSVSDNQTVTPGVTALTLAPQVPTVTTTDNIIVTPGVVALNLAAFAPTVTASDHQTVTPGVLALALTAFEPSVTAGVSAVPGVAALTLTPFAPSVSTTANVTATPGTASLTLTAYAPDVEGVGESVHTVRAAPAAVRHIVIPASAIIGSTLEWPGGLVRLPDDDELFDKLARELLL